MNIRVVVKSKKYKVLNSNATNIEYTKVFTKR